MRRTGTNVAALVVAAQSGDRRALGDLLGAHLPFVYTIVHRALAGHPDADDVVQETMLRALRELPGLRAPESFRAWLAAIAVRQVGTQLHRRALAADRTTPIEDLADAPDPGADVENQSALQLELSHQRGQVQRASRWLDPDDRALLSLWWLEVAGHLSRSDLSLALGVSVAHAAVRLQRMRRQLDLSRSVVVALEQRPPRCPGLDGAIRGWDGWPSPLWRKRIARHTASCGRCSAAGGGVAAERLLTGFSLLPVPLALTAGLIDKFALGAATTAAPAGAGAVGGVGAKMGITAHVTTAWAAHPVVASAMAAVTGVVIAGAAVITATGSPPPPPAAVVAAPPPATGAAFPTPAPTPAANGATSPRRPSTPAGPSPATPRPLAPGPISLESVSQPGSFVATIDTFGVLAVVGANGTPSARQAATFEVVTGLADPACFSFRLPDGQYLRHSSWRLRTFPRSTYDTLLDVDATFCPRPGAVAGSILLASYNYPGAYVHQRGDEVWVDRDDGSPTFRAEASFRVRRPLYR